MRRAFISAVTTLAAEDPRILLLTADLGYTVVEPFAEQFPERFVNVGVAEQNMVGLATGMAEAGFIPFVYSIASFAALRPYEFWRNGPIHHGSQVRMVGIGGGFEYGHNGISHYGLEDVGVMRMQPGMAVVLPADCRQAVSALRQTWDRPGPVYYRLGKNEDAAVAGLDGRFELGRATLLGAGTDLLMATTGNAAEEVVQAAEILAREYGIRAAVLLVSNFNPSPDADVAKALAGFDTVFSVESHYTAGGLGSYLAEVIAENSIRCRLRRFGVEAPNDGITGSQAYLRQANGFSAACLVEAARQCLAGGSR